MAPTPANASSRVWLKYTTGGGATAQEHELMFRFSTTSGGSASIALDTLGFLLSEMGAGSFFDGWQPLSARYSLVGQTISLPIALPVGLTSFVGSGQAVASIADQARELRFVGRSDSTGIRASMSFYGVADPVFVSDDFRIARAEGNIVDAFLDVAEESGGVYFVGADQSLITWRDYGNWQYNSYWESQLRT